MTLLVEWQEGHPACKKILLSSLRSIMYTITRMYVGLLVVMIWQELCMTRTEGTFGTFVGPGLTWKNLQENKDKQKWKLVTVVNLARWPSSSSRGRRHTQASDLPLLTELSLQRCHCTAYFILNDNMFAICDILIFRHSCFLFPST